MILASTDCIADPNEDIDDEAEVFIWGSQLSRFTQERFDVNVASTISLRSESLKFGVKSVDCGQSHVVMCTYDGQLLVYGHNDVSQCGIDATDTCVIRELTPIAFKNKAQTVACGDVFSLVATSSGVLYGCGRRDVLGLGAVRRTKACTGTELIPVGPFLQEQFVGVTVCAARGDYSCVSSGQDLWHVGRCRYLAQSLKKAAPLELNITGSVKKISLGAFFGALLTTENKLYVWGDGTYGEMGAATHSNVPIELEDPFGEGFLDVSCGFSHTLTVSRSGVLKVLGDNSSGQLGGESFGSGGMYSGKRMKDLRTVKTTCPYSGFPVSVFAGNKHSAMLTNKRRLYLWGSSTDGKMGQPDISGKSVNEKTNVLNLCYRLIHRRIETVAVKADATVVVCGPSVEEHSSQEEEDTARMKIIEDARIVNTDFGITRLVPKDTESTFQDDRKEFESVGSFRESADDFFSYCPGDLSPKTARSSFMSLPSELSVQASEIAQFVAAHSAQEARSLEAALTVGRSDARLSLDEKEDAGESAVADALSLDIEAQVPVDGETKDMLMGHTGKPDL